MTKTAASPSKFTLLALVTISCILTLSKGSGDLNYTTGGEDWHDTCHAVRNNTFYF